MYYDIHMHTSTILSYPRHRITVNRRTNAFNRRCNIILVSKKCKSYENEEKSWHAIILRCLCVIKLQFF